MAKISAVLSDVEDVSYAMLIASLVRTRHRLPDPRGLHSSADSSHDGRPPFQLLNRLGVYVS